jgi:ribosomal-protein-alanine N-acetyltransferase
MFLELQPLTAELVPAALEIDRRCFGKLWSAAGYLREIDSPNSELLVLCKQSDASSPELTLVGLGCYWAILEEAHITILAIDPDYQRQGLGQALLYALLESAHRRGLERATLEVKISNQPAIALYQKFEFQIAGKRRQYYQDTGEDALVLWRGGLQSPYFAQQLQAWFTQLQKRFQSHGWQFCPNFGSPRLPESA